MAKSVHPDVLDGALNFLRTNTTRMAACSQQPASFTEANTTYKLADVTLSPADFSLANGDVSGRKVSVAAKSAVSVAAAGTANHVALLDVANAKLLYVTTCPAQGLSAGGTVSFSAWDIEIANPA